LVKVSHELVPLEQEPVVLEDDAVNIKAFGFAFQAQATLAELMDAHATRIILVEQAEQRPRIVRLDVHGFKVHPEGGIHKKLFHLVQGDGTGLVRVDLSEDRVQVVHVHLLGFHALLDEEILVVLGAL